MCCEPSGYRENDINGECPSCGEPTVDGVTAIGGTDSHLAEHHAESCIAAIRTVMTEQHPITPPEKLVQQWVDEIYKQTECDDARDKHIATKAAQWGADQELEACEMYLAQSPYPSWAKDIRAARRPKPPTLNSIALQMLGTIERDAHYLPEITDTIRKALEQLDD